MQILISNDDGVYAEGIRVLANALQELATIKVVAPDRNRSGASNSLTLDRPIRIKTLENGSISVEGTPTDCVHLAITGLLEKPPSMVVSGINEGGNLGDDVIYSGTVAAAMEGRFLGLPAIAVSLVIPGGSSPIAYHYDTAGVVAQRLVQRLIQHPLPANTILNVNVPNLPLEELNGFEITRLGTRHQAERTIAQLDPRGHTVYWVGPAGLEQDAGHGTDFYAIHTKKVSITPLLVDLTHYQAFDPLVQWIAGF
ncbi:MAG TPA: 5'/3'-nucleotidase SurE [Gammaproteobacteria bacterium]|nr:5'/3'-nucleotidase SurE [Gammaproteobacteria bacterium]